jgi:hypothetical protein
MNEWLLVTVICLLVGILGLIFVFNKLEPENVTYRVMQSIFTGIFVCGVALLFGQLGILSSFSRKQMKMTFGEITTESIYPGKSFETERIKEVKASISSMSKVSSTFSDFVENIVYPMLDLPVRYNYEVIYSQKVSKLYGRKIMKVVQSAKWIYKSPSGKPMDTPLYIQNTVGLIDGIKPEDLFKITKFSINGELRSIAVKMEEAQDGRYTFTGACDIQITESTLVELVVEKVILYEDNLILWMTVPTKDIKFTYIHDKNLIPRFYVFGLGKRDAVLEYNEPGLKVWRYDGWLLQRHGLILFWSEKE